MAISLRWPDVVVGGHDITDHVRRYRLEQDVHGLPVLTVELLVAIEEQNLLDQTTEYRRVELGESTRAALIALGWTPPE